MKILVIAFAVCVGLVCTQAQAQWHVNVLWQRQGLQDSSGYGALILPLGDQNNDGYADWAVYAAAPYRAGEADSSYLEFFHGGNPPDTVPYMTYTPAMTNNGYFGGARAIGDVNGDGYQDWMVRVAYLNPYGYFEAQIFYGGPGDHSVPDARWHFHWETDDEQFFSIGDFNGDGYADLYKWRHYPGIGYACFGGSVFDTIPDWICTSPPSNPNLTFPAAHGDLNGDGFSDIIGGFMLTPPAALGVFWGGVHPDTIPALTLTDPTYLAPDIVRDVNHDGRDDLLLWRSHSVSLYWGGDSLSSTPASVLNFPCTDPAGMAVSLGDVNGDGYNDFALVNWECPVVDVDDLALYLGNYQVSPQPTWVLESRSGPPYLPAISEVVGLGDINGDGIDDIAIGSTNEDNDGIRGKAVIISGDTTVRVAADPVILHPSAFNLSVYPNPFNSSATITLNLPAYASEVQLAIFNILGQEVFHATLRNVSSPTRYALDASTFSSGIYFLKAIANQQQATQKLMILK